MQKLLAKCVLITQEQLDYFFNISDILYWFLMFYCGIDGSYRKKCLKKTHYLKIEFKSNTTKDNTSVESASKIKKIMYFFFFLIVVQKINNIILLLM